MQPYRYLLNPPQDREYSVARSMTYLGADDIEYVAWTGMPEVRQGDRVISAATPDKSLSECLADPMYKGCTVVDESEFELAEAAYHDALKTGLTKISEESWYDALEVLPPCRYTQIGLWEVFHLSEAISGPIVCWYAKNTTGEIYLSFQDNCHLKEQELQEILESFKSSSESS